MHVHLIDSHRILPSADPENLNELTSQCVKCGLCLPHCPTYALYNKESESPRGRIAIIEGMLAGRISNTPKPLLDCLQCGACEQACPSQVQVVDLIDHCHNKQSLSWAKFAAKHSKWLSKLARLAQHTPGNSTLARINRALKPLSPAPSPGIYNPQGTAGRIALQLGCITRSHQGKVLGDLLFLLTILDYRVDIPAAQPCCGALAQHTGSRQLAKVQVDTNHQAFAGQTQVLSIASACTSQLQKASVPGAADLYQFLAKAAWERIGIAPLKAKAALWIPCTQMQADGSWIGMIEVLKQIPLLEVQVLDRGFGCCGAGGTQILSNRQQATQLRQPILHQLTDLQPTYLLSSNVGCTLHLAEGLLDAPQAPQVLHPVSLLAQQVRTASMG